MSEKSKRNLVKPRSRPFRSGWSPPSAGLSGSRGFSRAAIRACRRLRPEVGREGDHGVRLSATSGLERWFLPRARTSVSDGKLDLSGVSLDLGWLRHGRGAGGGDPGFWPRTRLPTSPASLCRLRAETSVEEFATTGWPERSLAGARLHIGLFSCLAIAFSEGVWPWMLIRDPPPLRFPTIWYTLPTQMDPGCRSTSIARKRSTTGSRSGFFADRPGASSLSRPNFPTLDRRRGEPAMGISAGARSASAGARRIDRRDRVERDHCRRRASASERENRDARSRPES
jgi:hypothetical protein